MLKNIVRNAKIFVKFVLMKIHVSNVKKGIFGIMIEINVLLSNYNILSKLNA